MNKKKRTEADEGRQKETPAVRAAENQQQPPVQKEEKPSASTGGKAEKQARKPNPNNVRKFRMERMMSKAELARRAGISPLTVDRVERGLNCRMDTKRKILEALGLQPSDRKLVFPKDD